MPASESLFVLPSSILHHRSSQRAHLSTLFDDAIGSISNAQHLKAHLSAEDIFFAHVSHCDGFFDALTRVAQHLEVESEPESTIKLLTVCCNNVSSITQNFQSYVETAQSLLHAVNSHRGSSGNAFWLFDTVPNASHSEMLVPWTCAPAMLANIATLVSSFLTSAFSLVLQPNIHLKINCALYLFDARRCNEGIVHRLT